MPSKSPVMVLLLTAALGAQTASYTYINQKSPFKNPGTPTLTALSLPRVGQSFSLRVPVTGSACCPFTMQGWLATSVRRVDLKFDALGGYVYVWPDILIPTPSGSPAAMTSRTTMSFRVPNSSQLLGVRFYQQVLRKAWNQHWTVIDLSRGGIGVIGK